MKKVYLGVMTMMLSIITLMLGTILYVEYRNESAKYAQFDEGHFLEVAMENNDVPNEKGTYIRKECREDMFLRAIQETLNNADINNDGIIDMWELELATNN